jgi:hypothetical protein
MIFIGIDPGFSGGIAILKGRELTAFKMPPTVADTVRMLGKHVEDCDNCFGVLEKVASMPRDSAKAAFRFGENYGICQTILAAHKIPHELVLPTQWQREFGLITGRHKKANKTGKKNIHKAEAQRLYPGEKVTLATVDAILIAEYAKRLYKRSR